MKKLYTVISLILFLALFAASLLPGCWREERSGDANFEISKMGTSAWDVTIGKGKRIEVKCFLFPRSNGLEKAYQSRIAMQDEAMADAEKQKDKAPIPEVRKSYAEEYQLRKEERWPWRLVDSWPNCRIVVVIPVLTEKVAKVSVVCRPDSKSSDIALNMQSNQEVTFHDFLRIAREIVQQLDKTNVDWSELPLSDVPLYDDEGKYISPERMPKEYIDFYKDAVFPAQH